MDKLVAVGTQFMREINSAAILRSLRAETSMSVSALATAVGLSRQAVKRSLNALAEEGLVEFGAIDRDSNRAGRPAQLVRFRAEAGYVLGLSINPQDVRAAVSDLAGTTAASEVVELGPDISGADAVDVLVSTVERTLQTAGVTTADVWFATVGSPGVIDPATGVIKMVPSMPGLAGDVVVSTLKEALGCPVYLDNDVKLATEGERWRGAENRQDSMVMVHWGERVGAGIVLNGQLYRGVSNDAGDVGFLDLMADRPQEPVSHPDRLGAFEAWVGGEQIVRLAATAADRNDDHAFESRIEAAGERAFDTVIDAVVDGVPSAREAIEAVAGRFAKGIAAIRAIVDPELVVIGGPMARCGDVLLNAVRRHLEAEPLDQPALEVSALGDDAVVNGALHHSLAEIENTKFDRVRSGRYEAG